MATIDAAAPLNSVPKIPSAGPITRSRLRNTATVYALFAIVGLALANFAAGTGLQAFGLGLLAPGAGFVHFAAGGTASVAIHLALAFLSLLLFVVALVLWFGTGNQAAPIAVWLGAALGAGLMGHEHTLPHSWAWVSAFVGGTIGTGWILQRRNVQAKLARRQRRAARAERWPTVATPLEKGTSRPEVKELSPEDLAALRFALDRALQPVDGFKGFDFIEQFQPSAVRYQINNLSYALSLANFTALPAMHGYLHRAQRNLVEKKMHHRVWGYWALESLWGNFRHAPDPLARDNVMYSGWYATQLGLFEAATGDMRYDAPGAITLKAKNGNAYVHDYPAIARTLAKNERDSRFCLFPCEPNWIYPLCNNQAALGVRLYDRLHGTDMWGEIAGHYRRRLEEEFVDLDGHTVLIRSNRTGFTIPGLSSCAEDSVLAFWMHPLFPDHSERLWGIAREEMFQRTSAGLELLPIKPWLDPGNYAFNTAYSLGALGMAAQELGDDDAVRAVMTEIEKLETKRDGGVVSYPGCSIWSHGFFLKTRVGRTNGLSDLVNTGPAQADREGPVLDEMDYPDVLPARAVSDGQALDGVLYPGRDPGRFEVGLGQLVPGRRYRLSGFVETEAIANENGRVRGRIDLHGRTEIRVAPAD